MAKAGDQNPNTMRGAVQSCIVDFLNELAVLQAGHSANRSLNEAKHWHFSLHEWQHEGKGVSQDIVLIDDEAIAFFTLREEVHGVVSKGKLQYELITEKIVEKVIGECVARSKWHLKRNDAVSSAAITKTVLDATLFAPQRAFTVCLPVFGCYVDSPITYGKVRFERPAHNPAYLEFESINDGAFENADSDSQRTREDLGEKVIAVHGCKARFVAEAILIAEREVSNDLQVVYYSAMRTYHGAAPLRVPSLINRSREQPLLSVVAYDQQNRGVVRPAAFAIGRETPINLDEWSQSRWCQRLETIRKHSDSVKNSVATDLLGALSWLGRSLSEEQNATRLLFQITALEQLLPIQSKEERLHQVSLLATVLGGIVGYDRQYVYNLVRRAYDVRSAVVHGSRMASSMYEPDRVGRLLDQIVDYLVFDEEGVAVLNKTPDEWRVELMNRLF